MLTDKTPNDPIDWSLTTWEGSRREALRRWAALPLERIIAALEEMQALNSASVVWARGVEGGVTGPARADGQVLAGGVWENQGKQHEKSERAPNKGL